MANKIKVIVVDDSKFIRDLFSATLNNSADIEVVAVAEDPFDAREKIKVHNPDVITLDVEMPKMDGLSFLEKIMKLRPMPVVMVSTLTHKGADVTLRALEIGAVDYIPKPSDLNNPIELDLFQKDIISKVRSAALAKVSNHISPSSNKIDVVAFNETAASKNKLIAIGSSTGGVEALREILVRIPSNSPPIVITQHMPEKFTESFAKRLDKITQVRVCEARDRQPLKAGNAYIAPGGKHMKIFRTTSGELKIAIEDGDLVSGHKPSVDCLFNSIAQTCAQTTVGVILTGMGRDGAEGLLKMKKNGSMTIGQNADSCIVYGMPRVAKEMGAVDVELHITKIASQIMKNCE